jgi:hypothetical protein
MAALGGSGRGPRPKCVRTKSLVENTPQCSNISSVATAAATSNPRYTRPYDGDVSFCLSLLFFPPSVLFSPAPPSLFTSIVEVEGLVVSSEMEVLFASEVEMGVLVVVVGCACDWDITFGAALFISILFGSVCFLASV